MYHHLVPLFLLFFAFNVLASEVSVTIDDFNFSNQIGMDASKRNSEIIRILREHKIVAAGFVTTKYLDDAVAVEGVRNWSAAGHIVGNHTQEHWNYVEKTFSEFSADILSAEKKLKQFPAFQKIFRFPYLKEGESKDKRDSMRVFLERNNYLNGHVTIDASDWYINMRLIEKIKNGSKVDFNKYRDFYLKHLWSRSEYYSNLAKKTLGHDIKHTLLLHHNLTTALFLDDLIKLYKKKGWKIIDASEAFKDPAYQLTSKNVPAGESLIWALAKEKGDKTLRYPAEDGRYEKDEMDKLGL